MNAVPVSTYSENFEAPSQGNEADIKFQTLTHFQTQHQGLE